MPSRRDAILKYIAQYRATHGFPPTVREIAKAAGLKSVSTVAYYLRSLEQAGLIERLPERSRGLRLVEEPRDRAAVPLLGRVPAGEPFLAAEAVEDYLELPDRWFQGRVDFALRVVGDSMVGAGILDGDIALVRRQSTAEDGAIVVALLDDEATLKRLRRIDGRVELWAENPRYPPIAAPRVTILGRLTGLLRRY
jgi:repressor LexA